MNALAVGPPAGQSVGLLVAWVAGVTSYPNERHLPLLYELVDLLP